MDSQAYNQMLSQVQGQSFSSGKIGVIQSAAGSYFFTCQQVAGFLGVLSFSNDKLQALGILAPKIVDNNPVNQGAIVSQFNFSNDQQKARNLLNQNSQVQPQVQVQFQHQPQVQFQVQPQVQVQPQPVYIQQQQPVYVQQQPQPQPSSGFGLSGLMSGLVNGINQVATSISQSSQPLGIGALVHLTSQSTGRNLRIQANGVVDGQGGNGKWAKFTVTAPGNGQGILLRNYGNPGRYLRINPQGVLDGQGTGGQFCNFQVEQLGNGVVAFRSVAGKGRIGILPNGSPKLGLQTGQGKHGQFRVTRLNGNTSVHVQPQVIHQPQVHIQPQVVVQSGHQQKLGPNAIVHLRSQSTGRNLRIQANGVVDGQGGNGKWAKFRVVRISPGASGTIMLQNVGNSNRYLRVNPQGILDGQGAAGPWCHFAIEQLGNNVCSFRSVKGMGRIGILPNGTPKLGAQTGQGKHGQFLVTRIG